MPDAVFQVPGYIGIGSNLDDPQGQVGAALGELANMPYSVCRARSSLYRSPPMGPPDQPEYINAVARLDTDLPPDALLDALLALERRHGRERGEKWGPRTLDLDILLYGDAVIDNGQLTIPHPGLKERAFVLYPLQEIAPDLTIPGFGPLRDLIARCPRGGLERL